MKHCKLTWELFVVHNTIIFFFHLKWTKKIGLSNGVDPPQGKHVEKRQNGNNFVAILKWGISRCITCTYIYINYATLKITAEQHAKYPLNLNYFTKLLNNCFVNDWTNDGMR